ncbi:MAG: hypothetical protein JXP73_13490 [Deltaproteobacteria bacterium]|nr:hypothetical protein [Deltaproteobacteria bacterium]
MTVFLSREARHRLLGHDRPGNPCELRLCAGNVLVHALTRAIAFSSLHDHDRALRDLDSAAKLDPADGVIWYVRGGILLERNATELALASFDRALAAAKACPQALEPFCNVLFSMDGHDAVVQNKRTVCDRQTPDEETPAIDGAGIASGTLPPPQRSSPRPASRLPRQARSRHGSVMPKTFNSMRRSYPHASLTVILLGAWLALPAKPAQGAPYRGESRFFQQPNGTAVEVRLFGTEFYLRPESVDGYALALDGASGWICYAERAGDGSLRSTGIRYLAPADVASRDRLAKRGVVPGLRASSAHVAARVARVRESLQQGKPPTSTFGFAASLDVVAEARFSPTLGSDKGLVVLVDFSDREGSIPISEYENAFNGDTYDALGSIRSWIESISYGKYSASHTVIGYMRAAYPTSHYVGGVEFDYSASRELMKQVYTYIDDEIDLTEYASNGAMPSLVVIYPGAEIAKVWATGLWPHAGEGGYTTSEGVRIPSAFISNGGTRTPMRLSTFRHELGHSLFGWPDTYDYDDDSAGAGGFATETTLPCAPFRAWAGWMNVIDVVGVNLMYSLPANGDTCLRYTNASNTREFFVVEYMRKDSVKRPDAPDEGLLIWHVDERGDNSSQDMTATSHYQLSVEQADGLFELEKNGSKRAGDLFHADYKDRFDDTTTPDSKWWNGTASGFTVCDIGALDPSMSVSVGCAGPVEPAGMDAGAASGTGGAAGAAGTGGAGGASTARDAGRDRRDGSTDGRGAAEAGNQAGGGGSPGAGGASRSGGASGGGSGGSAGSGGSGGVAGSGGFGGDGGSGGISSSGGTAPSGGTTGQGGTTTASGGAAGGGGTAGGGASASGGEGGRDGSGGTSGSIAGGAGGSSAGGSGGTRGAGETRATASQAGCSCAVGGKRPPGLPTLGLVFCVAATLSWRRFRGRSLHRG